MDCGADRLSADCGGLLVSGATANFVRFLAARTAKAGGTCEGGSRVPESGTPRRSTPDPEGTDLSGLNGRDPLDTGRDRQQMIPSALRRQIERTGNAVPGRSSLAPPARSYRSVDPLRSLRTFVANSISGSRRRRLWRAGRRARRAGCPVVSAKPIRLRSTTNGSTRRRGRVRAGAPRRRSTQCASYSRLLPLRREVLII
jgi:hypothetical protein